MMPSNSKNESQITIYRQKMRLLLFTKKPAEAGFFI